MGWDAIIYLSAMAGIDQGLYEMAKVDGANRFQRIWHVTLPGTDSPGGPTGAGGGRGRAYRGSCPAAWGKPWHLCMYDRRVEN